MRKIAFILLIIVTPVLAFCEENTSGDRMNNPRKIPLIDEDISVDGHIDEQAWTKAAPFELKYETQPGENIPAPVRTEAFLMYSATHLYIAFKCFDDNPGDIRAEFKDRDSLGNNDKVAVEIDTFNDERTAFIFESNPFGNQADYSYGSAGFNRAWDGIFDSAGRLTEWGYEVEMAIPFSTLRFQRKEGPQIWGLLLFRALPREVYRDIRSVPIDRDRDCFVCQFEKIEGFEGATPGKNLEITPTITTVRTEARPAFTNSNYETKLEEGELGLTAKWGLTNNLTFSGTFNPDFSQVEADALKLDINEPFALSYTEKRPFFTEGNEYFLTPLEVLYTRTMRDPSWGMKLTGKEGANAVGAYLVEDDITNLIFPGSENSSSTSLPFSNSASVLRFNRDIWNNSNAGFIFTNREGDGYFNRVLGIDGYLRFTQTDSVNVQMLQSSTEYPNEIAVDFGQPTGEFSDHAFDLSYTHIARNLYGIFQFQDIGEDFRADLGFIPQVGYRKIAGQVAYTWFAPANRWWTNSTVFGTVHNFENSNGDLLRKDANLGFILNGVMQSYWRLLGTVSRKAYNGQEFNLNYTDINIRIRPSSSLWLSSDMTFGDQIDFANTRRGQRARVNSSATLYIGKHIEAKYSHTFERMNSAGQWLYTANIGNATLLYHFTRKIFFRSIVQYINYDYNVDNYINARDPNYSLIRTQFLLSYKINPRTVFFLGYSDNYYGNSRFDPTRSDYTFFAKIGYAWVM